MVIDNWIYMNRIIFKLGIKYYVRNEDEYFRSLVDAKEHIRNNI